MLAVAQDVVFHRCGQIPSKLVRSSSSPVAQNTWETMSHVCTYAQVKPITCSCGSVLFTLQTHWESVLHLLLLLGRLWPLCSPPSGRANAGTPCHALLWHRSPPSVPPIAISASCLGLFMPLELFSYDSRESPTTPTSPVPTSYCVHSCIYPLLWAQGPSCILQAFFPPLAPCLSGLHATEIQTGSCFKTLWNSKMVVFRDLAAKNTAHLRKWDPICKFRHVQLQRTLGCFLIFAHTCLESRPLKNSFVGVWSCWHTQRDASKSLTARKRCPCRGTWSTGQAETRGSQLRQPKLLLLLLVPAVCSVMGLRACYMLVNGSTLERGLNCIVGFYFLMETRTQLSLIIPNAGSNLTDPRRRRNKCLFLRRNLHGDERVWDTSCPRYPASTHTLRIAAASVCTPITSKVTVHHQHVYVFMV